MKVLAAALACVLLAQVVRAGLFGWGWGLDGYRDARANYHELMTNCEHEGGECIDVDFNTGVIGGGRGRGGARNGENENAAPRAGGARRGGRPGRPGRPGRRGAAARRYRPPPTTQKPVDVNEIFNYLYSECRSWEFDPGCYRKGNICCY